MPRSLTMEETAAWIRRLIAEDNLHEFYTSSLWLHLRDEVIEENHRECLWCKKRGLYVPAFLVHHQRPVREYPALALSKTYMIGGKEHVNLVPLCKHCHELAHHHQLWEPKKPLTPERW